MRGAAAIGPSSTAHGGLCTGAQRHIACWTAGVIARPKCTRSSEEGVTSMDKPTRVEPTDGAETSDAERVRAIRARLPGQVLRERMETAAALYGPLYTRPEIERRVAETLPARFPQRRVAMLEPIEMYRDRIPDAALLNFGEASDSGLFSRFWIARPGYRSEAQADPWIIGEVSGADRYAVIAQWE
jgi:hypothetical protein